MKIFFICGSLEPGCDGVGDYTRRLAGELTRQGHQVALLALNDKWTREEKEELQKDNEIEMPALRLPAAADFDRFLAVTQTFIDGHNPDWLSLQYVPFAFHPKGLPYRLSSFLAKLSSHRRWHIMFHELWVGIAKESPLKLTLWGILQKQLIKILITKLNPRVLHTQSQLYYAYLSRIAPPVQHLPLFSNIPVMEGKEMYTLKSKQAYASDDAEIKFVLFGVIHENAPAESFAKDVCLFAKRHKVPITLTVVGRSNNQRDRWVKVWQSFGLYVKVLGELTPEQISAVLTDCTIGISTTAFAVIDKSGTVAAMRAHGLPVLCVASKWSPRNVKSYATSPGLFEYQEGKLEECIAKMEQTAIDERLADIANIFSRSLQEIA